MLKLVSYGLAVALLAAGCGAADEHPLGGPYGGAGGAPGTSKGDGTGSSGDNSGDDGTTPPADDAGTVVDDSGNVVTPPPGVDSGTQPPPPGHDSGTSPPPGQDSGTPPPPPPAAPTWGHIWSTYLANGTQGRCPGCHSQMSTATKSYSWLQGKGYINGTGSPIAVNGRSTLSWFAGNMPPSWPSSWAASTADVKAWVAAGAANN